MKQTEKKIVQTRIELTEDEHILLKQKAAEKCIPLRTYIKGKVLDESQGTAELADKIMKIMPRLHVLIAQIENEALKEELLQVRRELCQRLK